ncbi:MAG: PIN domain-containing protein [Sedimentisphaerales bacterium]|nr:PIN domain-containing protein [Sedimentisphaerales bacterium]HNY80320.1 PIN domain-containing protein [Sedimentisphaerales bacterium]HOC64323.1 PIN domain-containing protein [Sedimentisphaerales bacterium]HOH65967.1 PIN domain-containing protein [Sedimentisphaerales bacterium]HPY51572.1 PIN domain-containing protein [Sedimentisphaerales bacterium]
MQPSASSSTRFRPPKPTSKPSAAPDTSSSRGNRKGQRGALLELLFLLDFDHSACAEYWQIRASLESKGRPIRPMDLLLAAQAKSRHLILVTNNEKEFRRIQGLGIENWTGGGLSV